MVRTVIMPHIISLPDGHLSLEYNIEDHQTIRRVISEMDPEVIVTKRPSYSILTIKMAKLLAEEDGEGLCLIASDAKGDAVLKDLLKRFMSG